MFKILRPKEIKRTIQEVKEQLVDTHARLDELLARAAAVIEAKQKRSA